MIQQSSTAAASSDALLKGARLDVSDVSMLFDDFRALDAVTASFAPGAVHAVVGQNGAGKTTFARVITGLYRPTHGQVAIDGRGLVAGDVVGARRQGIDMVHQNFSLPPSFTVAEALHLFDPDRSLRPYRRASIRQACEAKLARFGPEVQPGARVGDLSVQLRQGLEITRALSGRTRVLILDEPTAALSPSAVDDLFARLRSLAAAGVTILVVLHKLDEVWAVADTVTVLRDGRVALPQTPLTDLARAEVSSAIIGGEDTSDAAGGQAPAVELQRELESPVERFGEASLPSAASESRSGAAAVLRVEDVSSGAVRNDAPLQSVSLAVHAGEVVGVAGVDGNGQQTLVEVIAGLARGVSGRIALDGEDVTKASLLARRALGLRLIPFDRNSEGASLSSPIWLNIGVASVLRSPRPWFSPRRVRSQVEQSVARWSVKHRTLTQPIGELSGGNVQRAILAREATDDARLIIAAQPTRGLDLGATAFVHRTLGELATRGAGVLLISSDLDELRANSSRIVVLRGGRAVAELPASSNRLEIGDAMIGGGDA